MHKQRKLAWLVVLVVGLALIPAAGASAADVSAASKKSEKKQNKAIAKVRKAVKKVSTDLATLNAKVNDQGTKIDDLNTKANGIDDRVKAIEAGVPQVLDGLAQLKAGLETAGAGLTSLKTLATSTEYGFGQVISVSGADNVQFGAFVVTPDIPDTVQQAQTSQRFVQTNSGVVHVKYGVRSAESDGTGAANPAALCKVAVTDSSGATVTTAANAAIGSFPFQPVNDKSPLTSTIPANAGFPFGLKNTAPDEDKTTDFNSTLTVNAGQTYTVGLSCVDTSADANDPSA